MVEVCGSWLKMVGMGEELMVMINIRHAPTPHTDNSGRIRMFHYMDGRKLNKGRCGDQG